ISTNKLGESTLNISEFEKISETNSHLFMHLSTGNTLIIPTRAEGVDEFKQKLIDKGVKVEPCFDWKF
ncbi:MAG: YcxB family protein, partial [Flavobacteriia bacterium]|nr:YcxB family protein [Flavobacteriia bacterium]